MSRRFTAIVLAAAIAAGVVGAARGSRTADWPSIYVDYRSDCTFRLTNDAGATVSQVAPGTYQVVITTPEPFAAVDLSGTYDLTACKGFVNFRLTGPGVSVYTTLDDGDGAFAIHTVMFQSGATYTMQDDTNVAGTRRTFVASAAAPSGGGSTSSSSSSGSTSSGSGSGKTAGTPSVDLVGSAVGPFRGSLAASVTTAGKLALSFKGKKVFTLKSGRYTIVVLDETSRSAFKLQRLGKTATTLSGLGFVGRRTVNIALQRGQWQFYSSPGKKSFFVVTA